MSKPIFAGLWLLTLAGGFITLGGLGSLTNEFGVKHTLEDGTVALDFRLDWWYWSLEVFVLLFSAAFVLLGKFHQAKPAFVALAAYVNLALTPVIQFTLDKPQNAKSNVKATAAGLIIVVIGNFLLILLTAFFDVEEAPARPAAQASTEEKV